jgi:hypothetical protein
MSSLSAFGSNVGSVPEPPERLPPERGPLTVDRALQLRRLRSELVRRHAEWRKEERASRCATGLPDVDALLGGGFPKGLVSALGGPLGTGGTTLLLRALAEITATGGYGAWVDADGSLSAPALAGGGVDLSRLLWVKAAGEQGVWAAQLLARSGAFALVAVDVNEEGVATGAGQRLADAARAGGCAVVLLSRDRQVPAALKARLEVVTARPRLLRAVEPSPGSLPPVSARQVRLWIERSRGGGETSGLVSLRLPGRAGPPDAWAGEPVSSGLLARAAPPTNALLPWVPLARRLHTRPRSRWRAGAPRVATGGPP